MHREKKSVPQMHFFYFGMLFIESFFHNISWTIYALIEIKYETKLKFSSHAGIKQMVSSIASFTKDIEHQFLLINLTTIAFRMISDSVFSSDIGIGAETNIWLHNGFFAETKDRITNANVCIS